MKKFVLKLPRRRTGKSMVEGYASYCATSASTGSGETGVGGIYLIDSPSARGRQYGGGKQAEAPSGYEIRSRESSHQTEEVSLLTG